MWNRSEANAKCCLLKNTLNSDSQARQFTFQEHHTTRKKQRLCLQFVSGRPNAFARCQTIPIWSMFNAKENAKNGSMPNASTTLRSGFAINAPKKAAEERIDHEKYINHKSRKYEFLSLRGGFSSFYSFLLILAAAYLSIPFYLFSLILIVLLYSSF